MVALFVVLAFVLFIGVDLLLHKKAWFKVLKEEPGTYEAEEGAMEHMPEVGLTMADGKPEENEEDDSKK